MRRFVFWQLRGFLIAEPRLEIAGERLTVPDKRPRLYPEVLISPGRRLRCNVRVTFVRRERLGGVFRGHRSAFAERLARRLLRVQEVSPLASLKFPDSNPAAE